MTIATLDDVIAWDDDGEIDGLQFDGRERAIQEWRDRKEEEEYKALFQRLYKRNHYRRAAETPEGKARQMENVRRYRERNRERMRQRERDQRRAEYAANPVVNTCQECGQSWAVPFERKNRKSKFCSQSCRNKDSGRRRVKERRRSQGLRDMSVRKRIVRCLRRGPATSKQVASAIGGKLASVRCVLCTMVKAGELLSDGGKPAVFSIPERAT